MHVRVLLADDHVLVRQGLRSLLERAGCQVLAEVSDGQEALSAIDKLRPEIAVFDITMPVLNGLDAAREVTRLFPEIKTIVLTQHDEEQYVAEALQAGVKGYVLKSQVAGDLLEAIQRVHRGEVYLSPGISRAVVDTYRSRFTRPRDFLTNRERQVLQLIAEGKSSRDIGSILGISTKTAECHRTKLMQKLDIHEIAGLVRYAMRCGMISP